METKKCTKCREIKPLSGFSKHRHAKDGYAYHCKECNRIRSRIFRKTASGIYTTLTSQSKFFDKCEVEFTREAFIEWYNGTVKKCEYCDIPEEHIHQVNDAWNGRTNRLEIDRKDNNSGYNPGNVVLACRRCNVIRSDYFSYEEMKEIGQLFVKPKWQRALEYR